MSDEQNSEKYGKGTVRAALVPDTEEDDPDLDGQQAVTNRRMKPS